MPRSPAEFVVFAFETTHQALDAEAALKAARLGVVPIPTPAEMGGLCGLAMRLPLDEGDQARSVLAEAGVPPRAETVIEDY